MGEFSLERQPPTDGEKLRFEEELCPFVEERWVLPRVAAPRLWLHYDRASHEEYVPHLPAVGPMDPPPLRLVKSASELRLAALRRQVADLVHVLAVVAACPQPHCAPLDYVEELPHEQL